MPDMFRVNLYRQIKPLEGQNRRHEVRKNIGDVGDVGENVGDVGENVGDVGETLGDTKTMILQKMHVLNATGGDGQGRVG